MQTPWHPTTPIETLFQQIDDGIEYALAGESPIDDPTAVRIIYQIIFATGLFELPCRDWRARPKADNTLSNFKTFFTKANNDRFATTSSVGYHNANAAVTLNDTFIAQLIAANKSLQKTVEHLANTTRKQSTTTTSSGTTSSTTRKPPTFKGYCHTHGTTCVHKEAKIHNSSNCRNPGPNHNTNATETNKMGGNEKIWEAPQPAN